ncbi:MAG: MBL fold metallo-hydrolase [Acidobacteria bacterium]|nr:MBL fold metallo-hydrolase [Acidobacteriota bacterium]
MTEITKLAEGLWRWTAPHPDWTPAVLERPGGWGQMVGCLYLETPKGSPEGILLVDPLAPPEGSEDGTKFYEALDRDVARIGRPVAILLGNHFHERHAQAFLDRYRSRPGASIWAPEKGKSLFTCEVKHPFHPGDLLPGDLIAYAISGLDGPEETVFYDRHHRALICSDAILGAGGGKVRIPPLRWAENTPEGHERYKSEFRTGLRRLGTLDVEMVLTSHGDPALTQGRAALLEALESPAWGDE